MLVFVVAGDVVALVQTGSVGSSRSNLELVVLVGYGYVHPKTDTSTRLRIAKLRTSKVQG